MANSTPSPDADQGHKAYLRSGVAARLAGLPVETLRVWERRYQLCETDRSARGQRLYSDAQVRRLRRLKQLVDQGHPIGTLAPLTDQQLDRLPLAAAPSASPRPLRVALLGPSLAAQLCGSTSLPTLDIVAHYHTLEAAADGIQQHSAQVLLIEVAELDPVTVMAMCALRHHQHLGIVVLYRFAASAEVRQLRHHGCLTARAMADTTEIVRLCQAASAPPPAQRHDDTALAAMINSHRKPLHASQRYLLEVQRMLDRFERYSAQCAAHSTDNSRLHHHLGQAASDARAVLQEAMERLANPRPARYQGNGSP